MPTPLVWDDARIFLAIARSGSLSAAAQDLALGIATVSRRLERLEAALGLPLFSRHQSGYRLTDDGLALLEQAEALESAAQAFGAAAQQHEQAAGCVRLATAENFASAIIVPSLPSLLAAHPGLQVDLVGGIASVNLHRRDADLAVRMQKPETGNITLRRLGSLGMGLYAAPEYLAQREWVLEKAMWEAEHFIGWTDAHSHLAAAQWLTRHLRGAPCRLLCNSLAAQVAAAKAGLGLALLPHFLARPAGLVCLQSELGIDQGIWLAMQTDLSHSRRVRVVADHLIALFEAWAPALQWADGAPLGGDLAAASAH